MSVLRLTIDSDSAVPVYRQIAEGVRQAAREGKIAAGRRLPATRDLARQIGVNRNTVIAAYDYLAEQGWVHSHTGRGTFLAETAAIAAAPDAEGAPGNLAARDTLLGAFSREVEGPGVGGLFSVYQMAIASEGISFAGSYPAPDLMPVEAFGRALNRVLASRGARALVYGPTSGQPRLRETIAEQMRAAGSVIDPDRVLVTNGAQQAIDLVFHTFLDRGDVAIVEEPTYTGALSVLGSLGARTVGVPVDDQGMRPDLLAVALERHRPRLLYVQPSFHNPTTTVMPEARRHEILALARQHRVVVVEDDWGAGLRYDGEDPPTLHALDGGRQVIHISTFSKKLLPGLRVGWLAAPPVVMERLVALKQLRDCGTSPLLQAALTAFLRDGGLEEHLRCILPAYRQRRDRMLEALARHLPEGATWTRPEGGLFVWLVLPRGFDGDGLFAAARAAGLLYSRGDVFHGGGGGRECLRLTFSSVSPVQIETGISKLAGLIRERWPEATAAPSRRATEATPIL